MFDECRAKGRAGTTLGLSFFQWCAYVERWLLCQLHAPIIYSCKIYLNSISPNGQKVVDSLYQGALQRFNTENQVSNANTLLMEFLSINPSVIEHSSCRLNWQIPGWFAMLCVIQELEWLGWLVFTLSFKRLGDFILIYFMLLSTCV